MNLLVTAAHAAPAGPPAPPPPPPPPGAELPVASAIQAELDAEIAQAKADAAEALADAHADAAVAAAAVGKAQVIDAGGRKITVGPDGVVVERGGKTVTVMADTSRSEPRNTGSDGPSWIVLPIAIVMLVLLFRAFQHWTAVQAGYPIRWGRRTVERGTGVEAARSIELLANENERLRTQVNRLEERVAVLERIATDPARRVAAEIESLR